MIRTCILAATVASLSFCVSPLLAQDDITLNRGGRNGGGKLLGNVESVSRNEVVVSAGGTSRTIPVNEIQRIGFVGEPPDLRQARNAALRGQYEQALESLAKIDNVSNLREVIQQEIAYFRAISLGSMSLRGERDPKDAAREVLAFLKNAPQSYHYYEIVELAGHLGQFVGSYEFAQKYFAELAEAPWPEAKPRSNVLLANSLRGQGKFAEAQSLYEQVLEAPQTDENSIRQQDLARVGKAICLAESGQLPPAEEIVMDVIQKNDPSDEELFSQAYLALGTIHRKSARPMDAVLAYLHIDLLFFNQRDAHAEALYYLIDLWSQVNQPSRSAEARNTLKTRYPNTAWAKRST